MTYANIVQMEVVSNFRGWAEADHGGMRLWVGKRYGSPHIYKIDCEPVTRTDAVLFIYASRVGMAVEA